MADDLTLTYEVETDRGTFEVELDREPKNEAELQAAISAYLSRVPPTTGEQAQELIETGAPVAGSIAGGAVGAAAMRTPVGVRAGAGIGAAAGQQLAEVTRPFLTGQESTLGESAQRTGIAGVLGIVGEAAGQAATKLIGKVMAPFAKKLSPEGLKAQAALEKAGVHGAMTPAQLTESRVLDIGESITEAAIGGAGRMQAARAKLKEQGIPALVEDLLNQIGTKLSPTQMAQLLGQSRDAAVAAFKGTQRTLYENVDRLAKGIVVDTKPVIGFVRKELAAKKAAVERALNAADVSLDDLSVEIAGRAGQRSPETTFTIAQSLRSKLLSVARKKPLSVDDQAVSNVAGKVAGMLDDAMTAAAQKMNPDALDAFRGANAFTKEGIDRLEGELVRGLARRIAKQPSTVVPLLAARNKADVLRKVKDAVDPPTFERFQEALATHVIEGAKDATTGGITSRTLLGRVKALGDETAQLVFKDTAPIEELAKTLAVLERKAASEGTGRIFIQLAQAGAATELIFHPIEALTGQGGPARSTAFTVLLAPAIAGRLFTNPVAVRWLTRGFQAGPGTAGFFNAVTKALALSSPAKAGAGTAVKIGGERLEQIRELLRR